MNSSSTRRNTSVAVTAISSSLSTRPSSSIPPASSTYEPLVKSVLAQRFVYNVLSTSATAAWLLATIWSAWHLGGIAKLGLFGWIVNWLSPITLFYAVVCWSLAALPIAVLRKLHLTTTSSPSLSPRQALLQHASERRYQNALLVTFISSVLVASWHAIVAQVIERGGRSDPNLGIWAGSKKHPFHLNGRLCFLFLSQTSCALLYWTRDVLKDRYSIRWSSQPNLWTLGVSSITSSMISTLLLSTTSLISSLLMFSLLRSTMLPILYRLPIIHGLLRPFVAHFLRPTYTITFVWTEFDLIIRAFSLALSTQILWDITSTMFDAVFSMPVSVTEAQKDSGLTLIAGISSSIPYFQHHACHELCLLSSDSDQMVGKRAVIYSDSRHSPSLWVTLVRRSLMLLGSDYQLLLRRGNPPPPPPATVVPPVKLPITAEKTLTPVIRTQVLKLSRANPIDQLVETLTSDSSVTGALAQRTGDSIGIPDIFEVASRFFRRPTPSDVSVVKISSLASSTISSVSSVMPPWLRWDGVIVWWTRERKDKAAQKSLPNKDRDIMIIQVLSRLVSHSLREDTLGSVQRDIPPVLEAFTSFLIALEGYQTELSGVVSEAESNGMGKNELSILKQEVSLAGEWVEESSAELRAGISLIVITFRERLTKFRFPPTIALKLQNFVDYSI